MERKYDQLFQTLYDAYAEKIQTWAYRQTGDMERSKDIMQETFIVLWVKMNKIAEYEKLRAWLFRVARNEILHAYRDMQQDAQIFTEFDETAISEIGYEPDLDLMEMLPPSMPVEDKRMLHMRYAECRPVKAIADEYGISESACKMRLKRLRNEIKEKIFDKM